MRNAATEITEDTEGKTELPTTTEGMHGGHSLFCSSVVSVISVSSVAPFSVGFVPFLTGEAH